MATVSFLGTNKPSSTNAGNIRKATSCFSPSQLLSHVNGPHRIYRRKQCLVEKGSDCDGIYVLRSGSAKAFQTTPCGENIVADFFYPGDVIGLDALDDLRFMHSVQFLETSSVGYISINTIHALMIESADFRKQLLQLMSRAINHECQLHTATSHFDSQRRLASFLVYISNRFSSLGFSAFEFSLSMTRADIANYLGMAIETLSRLLTRFQRDGIIDIKNRLLTIRDQDVLNRMTFDLPVLDDETIQDGLAKSGSA